MRLLIAGDWHSNTGHALKLLDIANELECERILQLGDFGIWPGTGGIRFRRKLGRRAAELGIPVYFVDGNHEDFRQLYRCRRFVDGFRVVEPTVGDEAYVLHIPRAHTFDWGVRFKGVGGAVSVDKHFRVPGKSWWPDETLTNADLERVTETGHADVLLTHDGPTSIPMPLKPDPASYAHRQLMDEVYRDTQPKLWLHGHFHNFMVYEHPADSAQPAIVVCLECDGMSHSYAVLDTEARKLSFPTKAHDDIYF